MDIDLKKLAFDFDGVFADTMGLFLNIVRQEYNFHHLAFSDITDYKLEECLDIPPDIILKIISQITSGTYRCTLDPIRDAVDVLHRIGALTGSLLFVTARPHADFLEDWIATHLYKLNRDTITIIATGTYDKAELLLSKNIDFFVEDRLETCHNIYAAGITPILYKQPWNRKPHPFCEVENWQALETLLLNT